MNKTVVFFIVMLCANAGASEASQQDMNRAYQAALKCFVANGHVEASFKESGDTANERLFNNRAEKAFKLAYLWGGMAHLSQERIKSDLNQAEDTELRKLLRDGSYLTTVAKECKQWGMM